jgi:alcohol dehydrogenase
LPPLVPFDFAPHTRVVFGAGSLGQLGELTAPLGKRALVVTDRGLRDAGHVQRACELLRAAGIEIALYDDVQPNPTTDDVELGLEVAREARVDVFVGLGGGSSMDCAKGINFLLTGGGKMEDYWGVGKARGPLRPMVAIPTTAGTGSEAQSFALIAQADTHMKMACGDKRAACAIALLDAELTVSCPPGVTAATGIDALSHAVESYVTKPRNAVSQLYSRQAWRLIAAGLPRVLDDPQDIEARGAMLLGAHFAGAAI